MSAGAFQQQVTQLPGRAQDTLKQALAALAAQAPEAKPDESVLVQLAEHLAIRFALERFERGEVKVNAVRQMLDRMNQEIENLRKILGAHEDKMSEAGLLVQSHREILDRQFWAAVPESGKRAVLLSKEAWCIPPRNVQSYVSGLIEHGNIAEAISILQNYAACADSEEADARKKTAVGLSEMAELYAKADPKLLSEALRHLGLRISVEQDSELQGLVSAAFVRLSQEAATSRYFPAMEQALDLVAGVESQRPGIARSLRSKMGIEERVPEFVEEALRARHGRRGRSVSPQHGARRARRRSRGDGRAAEQARSGIGHGISAGPDERFSAGLARPHRAADFRQWRGQTLPYPARVARSRGPTGDVAGDRRDRRHIGSRGARQTADHRRRRFTARWRAVSARQSHRGIGENSGSRIGQHLEAPCRGEESVWLGTAAGAAHCRAAGARDA